MEDIWIEDGAGVSGFFRVAGSVRRPRAESQASASCRSLTSSHAFTLETHPENTSPLSQSSRLLWRRQLPRGAGGDIHQILPPSDRPTSSCWICVRIRPSARNLYVDLSLQETTNMRRLSSSLAAFYRSADQQLVEP
jgi:hypothetical protein